MEGDWFTFGNNLGVVNRVLLFGNDAVGNAFSDGIKGWLDGFFKIDHISDAVECLDQSAFIGQLSQAWDEFTEFHFSDGFKAMLAAFESLPEAFE